MEKYGLRIYRHANWQKSAEIINVSNKTLMVKSVWEFKGETTNWIEILKPGESKSAVVCNQTGIYVYDGETQKIIGYVKGENGKIKF